MITKRILFQLICTKLLIALAYFFYARLWKKLVSPLFCDLIAELIQNTHASVIVNGFISDCLDVHRGVGREDHLG